MRVGQQRKDPDSISLHTIDWTKWLSKRASTTITASAFTLPAALSPAVSDTFSTTASSLVLDKKGDLGECYDVNCHITTASGLEEDAVLQIRITNE